MYLILNGFFGTSTSGHPVCTDCSQALLFLHWYPYKRPISTLDYHCLNKRGGGARGEGGVKGTIGERRGQEERGEQILQLLVG